MLEDFGSQRPAAPDRRSWVRRHRALLILVSLAAVLAVATASWVVYLGSELGNIGRLDVDEDRSGRPEAAGGGYSVLLVGVDNPDAEGLEQAVSGDQWTTGVYRSDVMMVVHVDSDGRAAQLVSLPRDSWVDIPGRGMDKLNAAFSYGGPSLLMATVEELLDHRIDHVAAIDIASFGDLTRDLGGVTVRLSAPLTDPASGETFPPGVHELSGPALVRYVRERKNLPRGDLDRVQRQQTVMRSIIFDVLDRGALADPRELTGLVQLASEHVVADRDLSSRRIGSLAWRSRRLAPGGLRFLTIPNEGPAREGDQSVVGVDPRALREMFDMVEKDNFESWLANHSDEVDVLTPEDGTS